jgi:hypothetical protein
VSAQLVKLSGVHASLWVAFAFYVATAVTIGAALATEGAAGLQAQPVPATGS